MSGKREFVPVGPFREWLYERLRPDEPGWVARCEAIRLPQRTARRVLRESNAVDVALVDRVLLEEGSTPLPELYPSLYQQDEVAFA